MMKELSKRELMKSDNWRGINLDISTKEKQKERSDLKMPAVKRPKKYEINRGI